METISDYVAQQGITVEITKDRGWQPSTEQGMRRNLGMVARILER